MGVAPPYTAMVMQSGFQRASFFIPCAGWLTLLAAALGFQSVVFNAFVLIAVVIVAVHHAETVAHRVGEPLGTLILAVSVTIIEVGLIVSLMLANREAAASLARDTVFAAGMIILNMLLGLCLIAGARHQRAARFARTGVTAALSTLATLMVLTLILPNFTTSVPGPIYSFGQLAFVGAFSLALYLTFVFVQTVSNRSYFLQAEAPEDNNSHVPSPSDRLTWLSFFALLAGLGAVVLLAKSLSKPLQSAVEAAHAPQALVGIAIAAIVLLPESIAAVRAANANRLQTSLNLAMGSALATIGLTIPAVAIASFWLDLPLALGLDVKSSILLVLTLFVASLSLARGRTTVLHGAIHLTIFAAYLVLTILP